MKKIICVLLICYFGFILIKFLTLLPYHSIDYDYEIKLENPSVVNVLERNNSSLSKLNLEYEKVYLIPGKDTCLICLASVNQTKEEVFVYFETQLEGDPNYGNRDNRYSLPHVNSLEDSNYNILGCWSSSTNYFKVYIVEDQNKSIKLVIENGGDQRGHFSNDFYETISDHLVKMRRK